MNSKISLMVLSTSDEPVLALETEVSLIRLMRANFLDCSLRIFAATSGQYTANESFAAHLYALRNCRAVVNRFLTVHSCGTHSAPEMLWVLSCLMSLDFVGL